VVSGTDRTKIVFQCCTNKQRGLSVCSNSFRVTEDELESRILADIQANLLSPPVLSAIFKRVNSKIRQKLKSLRGRSSRILAEQRELDKKLGNIISAIEEGAHSEVLRDKLLEYEARKRQVDTQIESLNQSHDFDRFKVDEEYVEKWLFRMRDLIDTDIMTAKARLTSLIGAFTLSPEMVDGIKCLRLEAKAKVIGLLKVAGGERFSKETNTGGRA
jgi:hypothetical protein